MRKQDAGFDFDRYRKLLAEAVDETRRLAFIDLLVEERARDRLEAQRAAERDAITVTTIAKVLGNSRALFAEYCGLRGGRRRCRVGLKGKGKGK